MSEVTVSRGEPLQHALGLDAAAFADRRQMVVVGALCVQGDPVSSARPLVGDRQPATARPQHRDIHEADSIRRASPASSTATFSRTVRRTRARMTARIIDSVDTEPAPLRSIEALFRDAFRASAEQDIA